MSMPQSPYAPQPVPSPGGGPPGEPPQRRTGLIIALVVGGLTVVLAVLVVIALVVVLAVRSQGAKEAAPTQQTPEQQATALVTEYMTALEAGDAAAVLALLPQDQIEDQVLSAEAYAAALAAEPISEVTVGTPVVSSSTAHDADVPVTFTVAGQSVSAEYTVQDWDSDGTFEMAAPYSSTYVPEGLPQLGLTVNGEEVTEGSNLYLLPGAYELAIDQEGFTLDPEEPVIVTDELQGDLPSPVLTEEGQKTFRTAVQSAVDGCLAQDTLKAGCGIGEIPGSTSDGWTVTEGTVKRSISEDTQRTIDTMEGTPGTDEPTYVSGEAVGTVDTTMECTKDGQKGTCEMFLGGSMSVPSVDLADPEHPVTWS